MLGLTRKSHMQFWRGWCYFYLRLTTAAVIQNTYLIMAANSVYFDEEYHSRTDNIHS